MKDSYELIADFLLQSIYCVELHVRCPYHFYIVSWLNRLKNTVLLQNGKIVCINCDCLTKKNETPG